MRSFSTEWSLEDQSRVMMNMLTKEKTCSSRHYQSWNQISLSTIEITRILPRISQRGKNLIIDSQLSVISLLLGIIPLLKHYAEYLDIRTQLSKLDKLITHTNSMTNKTMIEPLAQLWETISTWPKTQRHKLCLKQIAETTPSMHLIRCHLL